MKSPSLISHCLMLHPWPKEVGLLACQPSFGTARIIRLPILCNMRQANLGATECVTIRFFSSPKKKLENCFWLEDLSREDRPALTMTCEHEELIAEGWFKNGHLHRLDGPAETYYRGLLIKKNYWHIDGTLLPNFEEAIALGDQGLIAYMKEHDYFQKLVLQYLENKNPKFSTIRALDLLK